MLNQRGLSILEVLVAATISILIVLGLATVINQMNRELKHASQKAEVLDFRGSVTGLLGNLNTCSCQFSSNLGLMDLTATEPKAELSVLRDSCDASAAVFAGPLLPINGSANGVQIEKIELKDIQPLGTPDNYRGVINFSFNKNGLVRALRDFAINIQFTTDPATPNNAKKFQTCTVVGGASGGGGTISGGCPEGQFVTGISNGDIQCSAVAVAGDVSNRSPANSLSTPGPGCKGDMCKTGDYGPCKGDFCRTNGNFCDGDGCKACAAGATCSGDLCCAGPSCGGC